MNQSLLHRIAINKTGQPLKQFKKAQIEREPILDFEKMETQLNARVDNEANHDIELVPRITMLRLVSTELDTHFSFKVHKNEGENYISAMRQVLSRARNKAKRKKMRLDEFKMLLVGIDTSIAEYDTVTLLRTKTLSMYEESVYDELFSKLKKQDLV